MAVQQPLRNECLLQFRALIVFDASACEYICGCLETGTTGTGLTESEAAGQVVDVLERRIAHVIETHSWYGMSHALPGAWLEKWIHAAAGGGTRTVKLRPEVSSEVVFAGLESPLTTSRGPTLAVKLSMEAAVLALDEDDRRPYQSVAS